MGVGKKLCRECKRSRDCKHYKRKECGICKKLDCPYNMIVDTEAKTISSRERDKKFICIECAKKLNMKVWINE